MTTPSRAEIKKECIYGVYTHHTHYMPSWCRLQIYLLAFAIENQAITSGIAAEHSFLRCKIYHSRRHHIPNCL
jgi:hypothetical protein